MITNLVIVMGIAVGYLEACFWYRNVAKARKLLMIHWILLCFISSGCAFIHAVMTLAVVLMTLKSSTMHWQISSLIVCFWTTTISCLATLLWKVKKNQSRHFHVLA